MASRDNRVERTHEKIVCLGTWATDAEKLKQIPKLTVDVTTYLNQSQSQTVISMVSATCGYGGVYDLYISLFDQDFSCLETELFDLFFGYWFATLELSDLAT